MVKMAIDVGFGRVKAQSSNGQKVDFPSIIGEFHPVRFISGAESTDLSSRLVIEHNFKKWYVGESALKQSTPQATVDKERTVTTEGITLLLAAMSLMAEKNPEIVNLVVGLPVMHYETLKQKYLSAVCKPHLIDLLSLNGSVEKKLFLSVDGVKILPQPFGTLFDVLLNERGELVDSKLASGKIGVVDIGYNTLDLARSDNLEFINPRSTSFSGLGMFTAFQSLSLELYRNLGVEITPERIEPIIRCGELRVSGQMKSIIEYKRAALRAAADQIVSRIKSLWPDRWELDRILISGGGAILLGEYLLPALDGQAVLVHSPMFANVSGYLKFANRVWKQ